MVKKTRGQRRGTRKKLRRRAREKTPITRYLKEFGEGQRVQIVIDSSSKSIPFPKFQGKTGKVIEKRGSSFLVKIKDGGLEKTIICRPEHLREI